MAETQKMVPIPVAIVAEYSTLIFQAYEAARPGREPRQALDEALRRVLSVDAYEDVASFFRGEWDKRLDINPAMAAGLEAKLLELGESGFVQNSRLREQHG